jgi:hypothetical protein
LKRLNKVIGGVDGRDAIIFGEENRQATSL